MNKESSRVINTPSASSMNKIMIDWKGNVMSGSMYKPLRGLFLACFLLVEIQITHISQMNAWAGSPTLPKSTMPAGDAERGRAVFNGKGVCYYCHGFDGNKGQRPQLTADTTALIAQLNPAPVDLKNPMALHLKNDKQRARDQGRTPWHRHVSGQEDDGSGAH